MQRCKSERYSPGDAAWFKEKEKKAVCLFFNNVNMFIRLSHMALNYTYSSDVVFTF